MVSIVEKIYSEQARREQGIFWSDETHSWVVLNSRIGEAILRSTQFAVHDRTPFLREIAEKHNLDIRRILDGLRDAPLSNNGEAHRKARRRLAAALAPRVDMAVAAFESQCAVEVDRAFGAGEFVDMFSDVLLPSMNAALVQLGGREINAASFKIASPTQLFSSSQIFSGQRLAKLNADIEDAPPDQNSPECPHLMTLFAGDPTLGSLGQSLIENISSNRGRPLCSFDWSAELNRTSLPFAERVASCDMELEGAHVRKDDPISVYIGAFGSDASLHFGTGAHRCLGEQLARQLWQRLRLTLARRPEMLEVEDVVYRGADFAFVMPIRIQTRVIR